jgi:hypothetical protein
VAIVNDAKHRCQALPALFDSLAMILQVRTSRQVRDEVPLIYIGTNRAHSATTTTTEAFVYP